MASSSSSSPPRTWKYNVFTSFHGPDVRKTFLSHLRKQFELNGITMFDDQGIERSQIINPALTGAIRESRISIVVLSKKYASSNWCLDELLEILKCKEDAGQIVMTVFYGVDPSDVRKQIGEFGIAFNETCAAGKTEEMRRKWSQALTYVGNIAGEDFKNWKNESEMIEKIARDVSDKLNVTPSRDFDGMVGLEAHLREVESLLDLDNYRVKIVGISGPAGIGKSTIGRALQSRLSSSFPLSCFMDNLRGHYLVEYGSKLRFQTQLLSKILNQDGIRVGHLGVMKQRLHDKKVLIILDDVDSLDTLEALANLNWFGPGSRVIVTTENKEILHQHRISDSDIYHVGFPSESEALEIFCLSAFGHTSPPYGFMDLAYEVVKICGNLPLGLHVLGSTLRGKSRAKWMVELPRLKNRLDGRIESVLKVGYENLHEDDQSLFLFIAVFFNYKHVDRVTSMLAKNNMDVRLGLENLAHRCLIHYEDSKVVMHHLLQVMARQVISKQEPWKRKILVDAQQIFHVIENAEGNGSIEGISFDVADINELKINARAFEKMDNLFFLEVYDRRHSRKRKIHSLEEMEFLPRLKLLRWGAYPGKSLPSRFCPENLIELVMPNSELEKLWEGTQPLANLKKMNLSTSSRLKELPDLSNATNLEKLYLNFCRDLVELPSSISNLHKLVRLELYFCESLEVIPSLINLASLEEIHMNGCSRLRNFPNIGIRNLVLRYIDVSGSVNLKTFLTDLPTSVTHLDLEWSGIERITDCIKDLHRLQTLYLSSCQRLVSLPELPSSLEELCAYDCESLERVSGPLNTPNADLNFSNCFKLDQQARQAIIKRSFVSGWAVLPGREVPAEFNHRARGDLVTIPHSAFSRFKVCVVISQRDLDEATDQDDDSDDYESRVPKQLSRCIDIDVPHIYGPEVLDSEHLLIFHSSLPFVDPSKVRRKIVLRFLNKYQDYDIMECGVQISTDEKDESNIEESGDEDEESYLASDEEEVSEKEDYESESAQASDKVDDDDDIVDDGDYESVSRKRTRETMSDESDEASDSEMSMIKNVRWGIQRRRL